MNEFFIGFFILITYYAVMATVAIILRLTLKIPNEVFRKILHFILLGSIFVFTFGFERWWASALSAVIFMVVVYPILYFAERFKNYSKTVTERKKGGTKKQSFSCFFHLCRGYFNCLENFR